MIGVRRVAWGVEVLDRTATITSPPYASNYVPQKNRHGGRGIIRAPRRRQKECSIKNVCGIRAAAG